MLSRCTVEALRRIESITSIAVIIKNDASKPTLSNSKVWFSASGGWTGRARTAIFSLKLLWFTVSARPDLIWIAHAHFAPVARWLGKLLRVPFVVIGNGVEVWDLRSPGLRNALCEASRLLAISRFTAERMAISAGLPIERMVPFPCTFDPERFTLGPKPASLLARYAIDAATPVILTVARLDSSEMYKGHDQVLRALPAVRAKLPAVRYVLAGRGNDLERLKKLAQELGVADSVIFAGYVPDDELVDHYKLCDVFAMPSKGEGFGIVFLEAAACGKPSIAGNKDGSVDAVLHGELGALVDPDNVDAIARTILQMLTGQHPNRTLYDPDMLRRRVIEEYGFDRFVERLREILAPFDGSEVESRR